MTARAFNLWLTSAVLLLVLDGRPAWAQVVFIDTDALQAQSMNAPPRERPVCLTVAVVRFLPSGKTGRSKNGLPTNAPISEVVTALGKQGQVNLLYFGDRDLSGPVDEPARFDSAERRPAFSLNTEVNESLTNREFGLHLRVAVRPSADGGIQLDWNGVFSWSPNLIDAWAGEKYLLFGMRVAKLIKPGSVYSDDDEDEGRGINIGGLFKKKPKETKPANVLPDISFLTAERQEVILKGCQPARPHELVMAAVPVPNADPKQPEFLYLLQQFTWAD